MKNLYLSLVKHINYFLSVLGLRDRKHWGVIYDSKTKQPVDPVVVRLIEASSGRVVASNVANLHGEYGFMASPGVYKLFVQRAHYSFPSERVSGSRDGIYNNLYTGQIIEFKGGTDVLSLNIPIDPIAHDFNQQDKLRVARFWPNLDFLAQSLTRIFFWFLVSYVAVQYFFGVGGRVWLTILCVFAFIILLSWVTPEVRLWGRLIDKNTHKPLDGAIVKITYPKLKDVVMAQASTVYGGKFLARLLKGRYLVSIKYTDPSGKVRELERAVEVGKEGLINKEFYI